MKREIKFRGKRLDNGEWLYGSLVIISDRYYIFNDELRKEVDPATVGQYTGLKDKIGREIYEGDILEYDSYGDTCKYAIVFKNGCFGLICEGDFFDMNTLSNGVKGKVIGNIHDNPELLNQDK